MGSAFVQLFASEAKMPDKFLTEDGLLAVPDTSNQEGETEMELEANVNEDRLLGHSDSENDSATNQLSPPVEKPALIHQQEPVSVHPERKRHYNRTKSPPEERIRYAEKAIRSLKRHTDKGTCPSSLKYTARANITADTDFKADIKRIRKYSENEFVKALTRFHYREIDRCRVELQREKRLKAKNSSRTAKNVKQKSKKAALSAPSTSNSMSPL